MTIVDWRPRQARVEATANQRARRAARGGASGGSVAQGADGTGRAGSGGGGMRMRGLWVLVLLLGLAQIALLARGAAAQEEEDGDGGERGQGRAGSACWVPPREAAAWTRRWALRGASPGWRNAAGAGCSSQASVQGSDPVP